jgi:hypothetical protein
MLVCRKCLNSFKRGNEAAIYCSKGCYAQAQLKFAREQVIEKISEEAGRLGRVPTKRELTEYVRSATSIFGSWNRAVQAAGLKPYRSHDDRMYKRSRTKALDGHRCDSISEAIVDNWLYKQGIPHLREVAYPAGNYKSDWGLEGRKVFLEYFGLAKDSPRYDATVKAKTAICRNYGIKLVPIFAEDLYPKPTFAKKLAFLEKYKGLL